jgi:hypothetical protein
MFSIPPFSLFVNTSPIFSVNNNVAPKPKSDDRRFLPFGIFRHEIGYFVELCLVVEGVENFVKRQKSDKFSVFSFSITASAKLFEKLLTFFCFCGI